VTISDQSLRDSIVQSLKAEPLLVEVEEVLHSFDVTATSEEIREGLLSSLEAEAVQVEADGFPYEEVEQDHVQELRIALEDALKSGASVTDAEREVLKSIGFEKLGEFRARLQTHLGGPAEIPDEDLAIYVPEGEGRRRTFRDAIEEQIRELGVTPEIPVGEEEITPEELAEPAIQPEIEEPPSEDEVIRPRIDEEMISEEPIAVTVPSEARVEVISAAMLDDAVTGLNPVPMMTAALEAAGVDAADFGFLLRYGRYAPEGRKSEYLVGGMGMAELSDRLAAWLKVNGPMDAQVQVVDEGSGELLIYLLGKEI
jgi:hypothetical protein